MNCKALVPVVVLIIPRFTEVVMAAADVLAGFETQRFAVGYYGDEGERQSYYREWSDRAVPLLLLRKGSASALDVAVDISEGYTGQPMAILIADGPEVAGFKAQGEKFCREFGAKVGAALTDVQVFLYSATWTSRPPRIR